MKDIYEAAAVSARWWAERIAGNIRHDNGDTNFSSAFAMCMADAGQETPSRAQIETFEAAVIRGIEESSYELPVCLCSDYGPGGVLLDAANEAHINVMNFPFKTNMFVEPNHVWVSAGYAQPYETIWQKQGGQDNT